jgi:hypothetical protein
MLVSLNGILQKPGSSFTISGSTMTFASNLATGDVIDFVQILGNVLDIGQPSDDTVTAAKLNNNIISGQTALTSSPASTDELLISDAGTLKRIDVSLVGSTNTPAFVAYKNTNQTISNDTYTKITFEAEQLDSDSTYDTSNSRFTPGVVGYYWIGAKWRYDTGTDFDSGRYALYKNGSNISKAVFVNQNTNGMTFSIIVYSDADDYFEMYGRQNSGSSQTVNGDSTYPEQDQAQFYAFRITGV